MHKFTTKLIDRSDIAFHWLGPLICWPYTTIDSALFFSRNIQDNIKVKLNSRDYALFLRIGTSYMQSTKALFHLYPWQEIVANTHYQTFLLLTILASTIQLLLENPIKSQVIEDFHVLAYFYTRILVIVSYHCHQSKIARLWFCCTDLGILNTGSNILLSTWPFGSLL